jgi:PhoH-like ATPase
MSTVLDDGIEPKGKLFVLDTNVLMHETTSVYRFQEHNIFLPLTTLDELDNHKKGNEEIHRNARQFARMLDEMLKQDGLDIMGGISLNEPSCGMATGRLFLQTTEMSGVLPDSLPRSKADHQILATIAYMRVNEPFKDYAVILVTKDILLRIKARALGFLVEDYLSDKVIEDTDVLYSGVSELPEKVWDHCVCLNPAVKNAPLEHQLGGSLSESLHVNQFVYWEQEGHKTFEARVFEKKRACANLIAVKHYVANSKCSVWGIGARNREQNFALNLLMNPEVDLVTLAGQAGTGKTLLALAAALQQVIELKLYDGIIVTRATVPVGEDIGFLPGTEEEKMGPWFGALEDNLEVLNKGGDATKFDGADARWAQQATRDLIRERIKIKSLNFMRGRTFLNKFLIIDEAQNLTPKQMKTLITRAGPGTKVVCLGNLAQIDTPYLTEGSSGLTYVVDRFKGWENYGHLTLRRVERSRLADHAVEVM